MGADERAARAQRVAKNVNLGVSVTMVELGSRTRCEASEEKIEATKAERKRKKQKDVKSKANLSLIENVSRLDCGGWEKEERICGIRFTGGIQVMSCSRDLTVWSAQLGDSNRPHLCIFLSCLGETYIGTPSITTLIFWIWPYPEYKSGNGSLSEDAPSILRATMSTMRRSAAQRIHDPCAKGLFMPLMDQPLTLSRAQASSLDHS